MPTARLRGEGLYLGAQSYAPDHWGGWNVSRYYRRRGKLAHEARSASGAYAKIKRIWTPAFSGTVRIGGGYARGISDTFTVEPFAALDYAFAFRPSL